jgi:type I restriction enzyme S subunit
MRVAVQKLGQILAEEGGLIQTGPFGSQLKQSEYTEEGVPVIMPTNIRNGKIDTADIARIPESRTNSLARHRVEVDSIVFPRRGEVTKRAYITSENEGWICGTGCLKIEPKGSALFPKYLYYFMATDDSVDWLLKNAVGSTMLNLSTEIMSRFPVALPPLDSQKRIAAVLSSYDDLIENNRRRIELLEEAARLLYREWFVCFRFPGHEHVKVVDGVPSGWRRTSISELSGFLSRGITPTYDDESSGLVINQKCIRASKLSLSEARHQSKRVPDAKLVKPYDVLINSTGAGTLGRVAQNYLDVSNLTVDSHVTIARPKPDVPPCWYGLTLIVKQDFIATLGRGATNQTELSKDDVGAIETILPSTDIVEDFESRVGRIIRQITVLSTQSENLAKARDLLLPRLMDGRLEV